MTTDPHGPVPRLAGLSVRTRLTVAVALLTGLALASAGLLVHALSGARLESSINAGVEQELGEFRNLQEGSDPATGRPFTSVEALVTLFLDRNVPGEDEMFLGYWDGTTRVASESAQPGLARSPALLELIERRVDTGGSERVDTAYGEALVTVAPTRNSGTRGALVLVTFLDAAYGQLNDTMRTYAIVSLLLLGLITAAAAWQAGRLLSPLRTLRDTAHEITETDLSRRIPETGNDDITALTRTLNEMLARLEAAFTGQRQFLDDAGHELKTPLTVLRGHLELLDTGRPEEVSATRDLLLDEVDRMSRLVQDMIWLAKTDRPGFFLMSDAEVAPLLDTVLEKCRALGDRRWSIDESADCTADLDEQRITQALLQLAQNAVRHTCPGDEIALGSRLWDQSLHLWVRDTGPGVADKDKQRIFERFARGPLPAAEDDDGFGLGLSIVSAIARAHGGTVDVADASGGGALFTLTLPVHRKEEPWPAS